MVDREFQNVDLIIKEKDKDESCLRSGFVSVEGHFFFPVWAFVGAYIRDKETVCVLLANDSKQESTKTISSKFAYSNEATDALNKIEQAVVKYRNM
jgi:hypothetical protein